MRLAVKVPYWGIAEGVSERKKMCALSALCPRLTCSFLFFVEVWGLKMNC